MPAGAGIASITFTATTTTQTQQFPPRTTALLLRAATGNTDNINVNIASNSVTSGDLIVRAGESVTIDITQINQLKFSLGELTDRDFIKFISYKAVSGSQTLYSDAFGL